MAFRGSRVQVPSAPPTSFPYRSRKARMCTVCRSGSRWGAIASKRPSSSPCRRPYKNRAARRFSAAGVECRGSADHNLAARRSDLCDNRNSVQEYIKANAAIVKISRTVRTPRKPVSDAPLTEACVSPPDVVRSDADLGHSAFGLNDRRPVDAFGADITVPVPRT